MEENKLSVESVAIKYGLYTTGGLIAYFLIMKLLGLVHVIELRGFNLFIIIGGILMGMRNFKAKTGGPIVYLQGIGLGLLISAVAVVIFAIFVFAYLQMDNSLMETIKQKESFGRFLNPYILAFVIALEGVASGFIATFVIMQYMKRSHLSNQ